MRTTRQNKPDKWEIDGLLAIGCLGEKEGHQPRERRSRYEEDRQFLPDLIVALVRDKAKQVRQSNFMVRLEEAANRGNETAFLKTLNGISWQDRPALEFVRLIKLAFRAGAFAAARHIATEAMKCHPNAPELQKYVRVLTSQSRETVKPQSPVNTRANRSWLEAHSGEYSGKWVALRNGELLGVADSLTALVEEVGTRHNITFPSKEIMLTTGY